MGLYGHKRATAFQQMAQRMHAEVVGMHCAYPVLHAINNLLSSAGLCSPGFCLLSSPKGVVPALPDAHNPEQPSVHDALAALAWG